MNILSIIGILAVTLIGAIVGNEAQVKHKYMIGYMFGTLGMTVLNILNNR